MSCQPRTVSIYPELLSLSHKTWNLEIKSKHITALDVCHESRSTVQRLYTRISCGSSQSPEDDLATYIDLHLDTIIIESGYCKIPFDLVTGKVFGDNLRDIRSLAIDFTYCHDEEVYKKLRALPHLQELTFVASRDLRVPQHPDQRRKTRVCLKDFDMTRRRRTMDFDGLCGDIAFYNKTPGGSEVLHDPYLWTVRDFEYIASSSMRQWSVFLQEECSPSWEEESL